MHRVCGGGVASLACGVRQELGPDLGGLLAERGNGAVAGWRAVVARGRRGIADDAGRRGDLDAAQLRMHREIGGGVDPSEGDVGGKSDLSDFGQSIRGRTRVNPSSAASGGGDAGAAGSLAVATSFAAIAARGTASLS